MRRLTVEGHAHSYTVGPRSKLHASFTVTERILNQLVLDNFRVGSREIEAHAAVLGFHAEAKGAALAQVRRGRGRMPIIRCRVPLHDVFGRRVGLPDEFDRSSNLRLDSDFHDWLSQIALLRRARLA